MAGLPAALVIVTLSLSSCGPLAGLDSDESHVFQIPFPTSVESSGQKQDQYSLQKIEIRSFTDPRDLKGESAQILVDPYEGSSGGIESSKPVGRFVKTRDGVMVPSDYVSMLATVIQAHMERLRTLNSLVGVKESQVGWPVMVGIEANVVSAKEKRQVRNNALFEKRLNALLMVPYSEDQLPIGMNGGILAHEHFHRIFQALVLAPLAAPANVIPESPAEYNETLLRAMNEGFADFWAWVYTGDEDFMRASLPRESAKRSMKVQSSEFSTTENLRTRIGWGGRGNRRENHRINLSYEEGTLYARLMHDLAIQNFGSSRDDRIAAARVLIKALPALAEQALAARDRNEYLSPNAMMKPLTLNLPKASVATCQIIERVSVPDAAGNKPRCQP